jgi:hypothetical protein
LTPFSVAGSWGEGGGGSSSLSAPAFEPVKALECSKPLLQNGYLRGFS